MKKQTITREQADTVKAKVENVWPGVAGYILSAIDSLVEPKKPEHWDGEPCTLPILICDRGIAKGMRFEYTGAYEDPSGKWYAWNEKEIVKCVADWARIEREMLDDGRMAVIVKGATIYPGSMKNTLLFSGELTMRGYAHKESSHTKGRPVDTLFLGATIVEIQQAIAAWKAKQPKPWTPKVGDRVWWDGIDACGDICCLPREVRLTLYNGPETMWFEEWGPSWDLDNNNTARLSSLSPLPAKPKPDLMKPFYEAMEAMTPKWKCFANWTPKMKRQWHETRGK